jgi:hypothetical protein
MPASIFADLCDIADTLSTYTHDFPAGPQRDKFEDLVQRLDAVIERTVGVVEVTTPSEP